MGTHLWSEVNAELQNGFNTKVFVKKYKKEQLQKYYWWINGILPSLHIHPPTLRLHNDLVCKQNW